MNLCMESHELCSRNYGFCVQNDELFLQNDEFTAAPVDDGGGAMLNLIVLGIRETMNCVSQMMDFVLKMTDFVLKMMHFGRANWRCFEAFGQAA